MGANDKGPAGQAHRAKGSPWIGGGRGTLRGVGGLRGSTLWGLAVLLSIESLGSARERSPASPLAFVDPLKSKRGAKRS